MLKASQLATVINEILDGVERSKCGKIQQGEETVLPNGMKDRVLNNLAYQTYLCCLNNLLPKSFDVETK